MEWSCLDWNTPSIGFYKKVNAEQEFGRVYFNYDQTEMQNIMKILEK